MSKTVEELERENVELREKLASRGTTVAEAGRKGVERAREKLGPEFYKRIGSLGGQKVAARGHDHFVEIGRKGGLKIAERGREHFVEIGKKGGEAVRDARGREFFVENAKKGAARIRELAAKGRQSETAAAAPGGEEE